MHHHHARPADSSRTWQTPEATHIDVRGLNPPEPMIAILQMLDSGQVNNTALIAHLDRDPIFLYPELEERGWAHEIMPSSCGSADCEDGIVLRMVRWGP